MPPRGMCVPSTKTHFVKHALIPKAYCADDPVPLSTCKGYLLLVRFMGRPIRIVSPPGKKLFGRAGTELRHRSWAVHRLEHSRFLKS